MFKVIGIVAALLVTAIVGVVYYKKNQKGTDAIIGKVEGVAESAVDAAKKVIK